MSRDHRLQALAREAQTGDQQARARWLRARVQAGERSVLACQYQRPDRRTACGGRGRIPREGKLIGSPLSWDPCSDCDATGRAPFAHAVELLAYLGDPAAQGVTPGFTSYDSWLWRVHGVAWGDCGAWLRGLSAFGDEVMRRAAEAAFADEPLDGVDVQAYTDHDTIMQLAYERGQHQVRESIRRRLTPWLEGEA